MSEPDAFVRIVPLARGFRCDVQACHPRTGERRRFPPSHFGTVEQARGFAGYMATITGCAIIEESAPA